MSDGLRREKSLLDLRRKSCAFRVWHIFYIFLILYIFNIFYAFCIFCIRCIFYVSDVFRAFGVSGVIGVSGLRFVPIALRLLRRFFLFVHKLVELVIGSAGTIFSEQFQIIFIRLFVPLKQKLINITLD